MTDTEHNDDVWRQAVDWIMREHENSLDAPARSALRDWLVEATHRQAYEQARTLWLITGLIPSADELLTPE